MAAALDAGILCFNVESEPELVALSESGAGPGRATAPVSSGSTRTSTPRTHAKISTGKSENKFRHPDRPRPRGLCPRGGTAGIAVHGVDMHIGSQITDLAPYDNAAALLADSPAT